MLQTTSPIALPCGKNCENDCEIRNKMIALERALVTPPEDGAAELVQAFFNSYQELLQTSEDQARSFPPEIALPALFDFVVSAKYVERMLANEGWTYCSGSNSTESPALFFPFIKTCPRCSVLRGTRPRTKANKPNSDPIGAIANDTTMLIFAELMKRIAPEARIVKSPIRGGDVDLVIYDQDMMALIETKSSPLAVYPVEIILSKPMTASKNGEVTNKLDHSDATADISGDLFLYVPHFDLHIPLGGENEEGWPFLALVQFVKNKENVVTIISAWKELLETYSKGKPQATKDRDFRRWITCGCGGPVDDSKNAPGLDRSDDVKKGTYQVLKFGTYYKEKCPRNRIRSVLLSNFMALHGFEQYLSEMQDVIWTKEKYFVTSDGVNPSGTRVLQADRAFSLYDAVITLTRSLYRDKHLQDISSIASLIGKFTT